ncbi:hypothetical protein ACWDA3_60310 [Nonomuraea rubra]
MVDQWGSSALPTHFMAAPVASVPLISNAVDIAVTKISDDVAANNVAISLRDTSWAFPFPPILGSSFSMRAFLQYLPAGD